MRIVVMIILCLAVSGCIRIRTEGFTKELADQLSNHDIAGSRFDPEDPLIKQRMILINGSFNTATARNVTRALIYLDRQSAGPIALLINSGGGDGTAYLALANVIKSLDAPVNAVNMGLCGSSAFVLYLNATGKRYAMKDSIFAMHDFKGSPEQIREMFSSLQEDLLREKCDVPEDWLPLHEKEYFVNPTDAVKYAIADEVIEKVEF